MVKFYKSIDNPIFVGGIRRSGTSLIRSRISSHKKILSGPETFWFTLDFKKRLGRKASKLDQHILNLMKAYNIKDKKFFKELINVNSRSEFLNKFYNYLLSKKKFKQRWLEKTTENTFHIDYIFKNWKNSLFIYVYRNPRSIFASLLKSNTSFTINSFSSEIINHYKIFNKFYKKYKKKILIVSYEEFIENYDKIAKSIFKFIKEDINKSNNDYLKDNTYEIIRRTYNHKSHSLLNIKKHIFKNRIYPTLSLKNEAKYKKILKNLSKNMRVISKYCNIKLWKL